ncbi:DUF3604 domain-containing protein [Nannocystaceae bacterium ST9]
MPRSPALLGASLLASLACSAEPTSKTFTDEREPCSDHNPQRNLYFGDLHVHTAYSFDAYINEVRVDPAEAYEFARGRAVELPDGAGGLQTRTIDRPLDFAAVTDHGEYLGEVAACVDPDSPAWSSDLCVGLREGDQAVLVQWGLGLGSSSPIRPAGVCDSADCPNYLDGAWTRVQQAAEAAYDRSAACEFTSFVAYEWSGATMLSNLHRNVIFRTAAVPDLPITHFEEPSFWNLWDALDRECIAGLANCDVLAIPHNTNWSNGNMFVAEYPEGRSEAEWATLRAELEPLIELYQHKGDSECMNGLSGVIGEPDEACEFEKLRTGEFDDCGEGTGMQGMVNGGCVSRLDFYRGILGEGLREAERLGINPYKLGAMASTDTHNGTPGAVEEFAFVGHFGNTEGGPRERLTGEVPGGPNNSPGGLIAVWAEENSRNSIFEAMKRRETYGTSGPRMALRLFAGWDFPGDLCSDAALVEQGYARGVPMGGDLPARPSDAGAPRFVVSAFKDPGTAEHPGRGLERAQIIKGWLDAEGELHVEVYDVAGEPGMGGVDPATCEETGSGAASLCSVWEDPGFDPGVRAWYYLRVLELPTCRWSARDCNSLAAAGEELPESCGEKPGAIQERGWSSPIWYSP